jgi:hypothetical protein
MFGDFFPSFGWIDVLAGIIPSLKATFEGLDIVFDQVIEEHETQKNFVFDFVEILLQLQKNSMLEFEFTKNSLKAILLVSLSLSLSLTLPLSVAHTQA